MKKAKGIKISMEELQQQQRQRQQQLAAQEAQGKTMHTRVVPPVLPGGAPESFSSKGVTNNQTYSAQLVEYRADAVKLGSDAERIQFWLNKAQKRNEAIQRSASSLVLHNHLLEKRTYLREAIALGSVEAALQQDQLIQLAVQRKVYGLLGGELNLFDPIIAAAVRISPILNFYFKSTTTGEEKIQLHQAMIAAFPVDAAGRAAAMQIILKSEDNTAARNEVATYVFSLPRPNQPPVQTVAYAAGSSNGNASSSSSSSSNSNAPPSAENESNTDASSRPGYGSAKN